MSYILYGLQAAANFNSSGIGFPYRVLSHITSLISPNASVVLTSSKKRTVYTESPQAFLFFLAYSMAASTSAKTRSSLIPP